MKYGIFEAKIELKKLPERLFDIVCEDTEIGHPEKIYDSKAEALAELEKYRSLIRKESYAGIKSYDCIVYFVAECEKIDEDEGETIDNLIDGDGIETAPLEREISLSPAEFKVNGKNIKGSKLEGGYEPLYIAATPDELEYYYFKETYPDDDIEDNIRSGEETYDEYELDEEE